MKNSYRLYILILIVIILSGCKKDDEPPENQIQINITNGVIIVNEGLFPTGSGTLSLYNRLSGETNHKIYQQANNGKLLGNIVQSVNVINNKVFIIVNNADKIEVAESTTMKAIATIKNIPYPRYMLEIDSIKAYITCWDNTVKVIDTESYDIIKSIPVGTGPEKLLKTGNKVFVLNQGGFDIDSTITVIDTESDEVIETIQVFPKPTGITTDKNNHIWVLCSGRGWNGIQLQDDSEGHLICLNPADYSILHDIEFPSKKEHPVKLVAGKDRDNLYYYYTGGLYRFNIDSINISTEPFIKRNMYFGLGFDRVDDLIYISDPVDYVQEGWVLRYMETGTAVDSFKVGIIPGEFYFLPKE